MGWICAVRRKEGGKGEERLYYRDEVRRFPDATHEQFLRELFDVQRLRSISLRTVDEADLPKLSRWLRSVRGVPIYYEAAL